MPATRGEPGRDGGDRAASAGRVPHLGEHGEAVGVLRRIRDVLAPLAEEDGVTRQRPSSRRSRLVNVPRSASRSWSSRGNQRASSIATESSAHSVVPLKPSTVPVEYRCASIVMSLTVNSSVPVASMSWERNWKRSPAAGCHTRPASRRRRASAREITGSGYEACPGGDPEHGHDGRPRPRSISAGRKRLGRPVVNQGPAEALTACRPLRGVAKRPATDGVGPVSWRRCTRTARRTGCGHGSRP